MKSYRLKLTFLALLASAIVAFSLLLPQDLLSLSALRDYKVTFSQWYQQHQLTAALGYFTLYVAVTALSLPGATLLTLSGGAVFGLWTGGVLVSFASTAGATLAMLFSRYMLAEWVTSRFPRQIAAINAGMARNGACYLFALRLMPLFPFFLVNLLAGVIRLSVARYWWVSQLGMLPATLVYLNAGCRLGELRELKGILSPGMLLAFTLIGLLPLVSRWLLKRLLSH